MTGLYAEGNRPAGMEAASRDIRKDYYASRSNRRQVQQQYRVSEPPSYYGVAQSEPRASVSTSLGISKKQHGPSISDMERRRPQRYAVGGRPPSPKQRPSTPSDFPFIFGDPVEAGSVQTGSSQQELLRKKARTESKKRQKKFSKKKKEPKIVNMPPSLISSSASTTPVPADTDRRAGEYQKQKYLQEKSFGKSSTSSAGRWPITSRSSVDEKESLTAESTVTDSNASINQKQYDRPYSTVALPAAVVKSESLSDRWEDERKEDGSEFSFPLLSTQATGARKEDRPQTPTIAEEQDQSTQSSGSSRRRNVRFSKRLEQSTTFLAENQADYPLTTTTSPGHAAPMKNSKFSPTSVLDHPASAVTPKSILRDAKYTRQGRRNTTPIDTRNPAYIRATIDSANAALYGDKDIRESGPVGYSSPNRAEFEVDSDNAEPRFVDNAGAELSPIRPGNISFQDEAQKELLDEERDQQRTSLAQPTQTSGGSNYALHNDEGSVASRMAFIEAVAAVVIQTAFRRHVARQIVAMMRESKRRNVVTKAQRQRDSIRDPLHVYEQAAALIQAVFRGFWARDCLNVDRYCATAIQRVVRGYHCRMNYNFDLYRIIVVQSVWRRSIAREQVSFILAYIIVIQSAIRRFLSARRALKIQQVNMMLLTHENAAATVIQSKWRMHSCWSRYTELLFTLIIQSAARGWLGRRKAAQLRAAKKSATVSNARRRMGSRMMKSRVRGTAERPLKESMASNLQGSSALSRQLPAVRSKQKRERAIVASNPSPYEGGPFLDDFEDTVQEQNVPSSGSKSTNESGGYRKQSHSFTRARKTGCGQQIHSSDHNGGGSPSGIVDSSDKGKDAPRRSSSLDHSSGGPVKEFHTFPAEQVYNGVQREHSLPNENPKNPPFESVDSLPNKSSDTWVPSEYQANKSQEFDVTQQKSACTRQEPRPEMYSDKTHGWAYEVWGNKGLLDPQRQLPPRPLAADETIVTTEHIEEPVSTNAPAPPPNREPEKNQYQWNHLRRSSLLSQNKASTGVVTQESFDTFPEQSPADGRSIETNGIKTSQTNQQEPLYTMSFSSNEEIEQQAYPELYNDNTFGWAYQLWGKKGLLDPKPRHHLANDEKNGMKEQFTSVDTLDANPSRSGSEENRNHPSGSLSSLNENKPIGVEEANVGTMRNSIRMKMASQRALSRNAAVDIRSGRSPTEENSSVPQGRWSEERPTEPKSRAYVQDNSDRRNNSDARALSKSSRTVDNDPSTFVQKPAPEELLGDASKWRKERKIDNLPTVDKSHDPYAWAYSLWATKGFLEWEPSE